MKYERLTKRTEKGVVILPTSQDEFRSIWNAIERLAELEDKIENGTLIELPCKVGDTVYHLYCCDFRDWKITKGKIVKIIHELGYEDKVIEERKGRNNVVFRYFVDIQNLLQYLNYLNNQWLYNHLQKQIVRLKHE